MKIILTGASGLIGSRFEELMHENHEIVAFSSKDLDITNCDDVYHAFESKAAKADVVIHLAAKTNVDSCEEDKIEDERLIKEQIGNQTRVGVVDWDWTKWIDRNKSAFAVNFIGTKVLYSEAKDRGIKFVYISTDFVFEGNGNYDEESESRPINWYGMTKHYGEQLIDTSRDLIVRLSFPYGYPSDVKNDFFWALVDLLNFKDEVSLIEDQTITPTFIDDIVNGLDFLLAKGAIGIYHLTGSSFEDPLEIGHKIKEKLGLKTKINATTREKLYAGKAARPFQSILKNAKLAALGFEPKTFDQGFDLILK